MIVPVLVALLSTGEQAVEARAAPAPVAQATTASAPADTATAPAPALPPAATIPAPAPDQPAPATPSSVAAPAPAPAAPPPEEPAQAPPGAAAEVAPPSARHHHDLREGHHPTDLVVRARARWEVPDPLSKLNADSYQLTQKVDGALVGPAARFYKSKLPEPVRDGIHNFLYNLREPVVFLNYLLQLKIGKAFETAGRFGLNTTIGAAGLFDMAKRKPFHLPRRSNGFADTLGFYGVPNGAFLYLPLVGPTTVRDLLGGAVDRLVMPVTLGRGITDPKFAIPVGTLSALDHRSNFDDAYKAIRNAPGDPYANARDFYLQRRQAEIDVLHGRHAGHVGGMSTPPTGTIRLKQRDHAPALIIPVGPTTGATGAPATAPAAPATPVTGAPVTGTTSPASEAPATATSAPAATAPATGTSAPAATAPTTTTPGAATTPAPVDRGAGDSPARPLSGAA